MLAKQIKHWNINIMLENKDTEFMKRNYEVNLLCDIVFIDW